MAGPHPRILAAAASVFNAYLHQTGAMHSSSSLYRVMAAERTDSGSVDSFFLQKLAHEVGDLHVVQVRERKMRVAADADLGKVDERRRRDQ